MADVAAVQPGKVDVGEWIGARLAVALALVAGVFAAWNALLGWDDQHNADGTGPYGTWQVVGLILVVGAMVVAAGVYGFPFVTMAVVPVALGAAAFQDWSQTDDSGLFFVGVFMVTAGSFLVVAAVASVAYFFGPKCRPEA